MTAIHLLFAMTFVLFAVQADLGTAPLNHAQEGILRTDGEAVFSIYVVEGVSYSIEGTCDADCTDLDLTLLDPVSQRVVAQDTELDVVPVLHFEANRSGVFDVRVAMAHCAAASCSWHVETGEMRTGLLPEAATKVMDVLLHQGAAYRFEGHCDADCGDVDLTLTGLSGVTVADDHLPDDFPVLFHAPERTGSFVLEVTMASCDVEFCVWAVILYVE